MLKQDQLIAYFEDRLSSGERTQFEAALAEDRETQILLAEQQNLHFSLQVLLNKHEDHVRIKNSIFAVLRSTPAEQLTSKVLASTTNPKGIPNDTAREFTLGRVRNWLWRQWIAAGLPLFRWKPLPFVSVVAAILLVCGIAAYLSYQPPAQMVVGRFITVIGEPTVGSNGRGPSTIARASSLVHLGDAIQTGDADRAEVIFRDGTALRLGFNTTVTIPVNKPRLSGGASEDAPRPPQIDLLGGEIWTRVKKTAKANRYAVRTSLATAVAKGTEFGVRLRQENSPSTGQSGQSKTTAVLTVKEGKVEFFNSLGSVEATAMTESTARQGLAPSEPKRIQTLQLVRLSNTLEWSILTGLLDWPEAAERMVPGGGWAGLKVRDLPWSGEGTGNPSVTTAVRVVEVMPQSPAAAAGIQIGDIITELDGQPAAASHVARAVVLRSGTPVALTVYRDGAATRKVVTPTHRPVLLTTRVFSGRESEQIQQALRAVLGSHTTTDGAPSTGGVAVQAAVQNNMGAVLEVGDAMGPAIRSYRRAVVLQPDEPLYRFNLALALRKIGSFERAREELESAATLRPDSVVIQKHLAEIKSLLGNDSEALAMSESLLKGAPQDHGTWELHAQLLLKSRRPKEAADAARRSIEFNPDCAVAYSYFAEALHQAGQLAEAENAWREALAVAPFEAVLHLNLGSVQHDRGQAETAHESFRRATELNPQLAMAWHNLGDSLVRLRDYTLAETALRRALEIDGENLGIWCSVGTLALKKRDAVSAEAAFKRALSISPTSPEATYGLGQALRLGGLASEAELAYRAAVELKPDYAAAHTALGLILYDRGQADEAEILYRRAIQLDPLSADPHHNLGTLYREFRRDLDAAEQHYRNALELSPGDPVILSSMGVLLAERGDLVEAEKMLRSAWERDPNTPGVNNNLGELLRRRGLIDEALPFYEKALELDPANTPAYGNLGVLYAMLNRFADAENVFRALLARKQGLSANARIAGLANLAMVCGKQGRIEEGEVFFRQALEMAPNDPRLCSAVACFFADHGFKLDEALELSARAVRTAPTDPHCLDALGWVHCQRGELESAERFLRQALELAGQAPPAPEIREHLTKLLEKKRPVRR